MQPDRLNVPFDAVKFANAGSIVYPPGGRFGPRSQHNYQLVMLYTGEMTITIDNRELHVLPGHVVLLKPSHEELFVFSRTEETWHRWIHIHAPELGPELREALDRLPECLPLTEEMNRLVDLMMHAQRDMPDAAPLMRSLGLAALHLYPAEARRTELMREKHPAVYAALAWIRDHYSEELSLRDLSRQAGVSSEHLVRLFNQLEGTTPMQFLWNYRVGRAVELLTNTGLTISEISTRCGFKTSHHLARLIKQATGHTASEIRRLSWSSLRRS